VSNTDAQHGQPMQLHGPRPSGGSVAWCLGGLFILPDTPCAREFSRNGI